MRSVTGWRKWWMAGACAWALQAGVAMAQSPAGGAGAADADGDDVEYVAQDGSEAPRDLGTFVVSGRQPGPGMWVVSKGEHRLYVLGTLSPLSRRMEWNSIEVEGRIARSQAVLSPPSLSMSSDAGMFRSLLLLPSLLKARRNPDGKMLDEVVSPELYARWTPLKTRYLGRDRGVEKWRPIFAAQELYEAAMKQSGLTQDRIVGDVVEKAAKRAGLKPVSTNVKLVIKDPKAAIKEFNTVSLADTECFSRTLSRIETDLDAMRRRANAWAIGDVDALRAHLREDQYAACIRAVTETGLAQRLGISNLGDRVRTTWLAAAEAALAEHPSTFATLPMGLVLGERSYLESLRAKGYTVEAPVRVLPAIDAVIEVP